jgi:hypothetical protein
MSKTIYKYPIEVVDEQDIKIPQGAMFLSIQEQDDKIVLYYVVDPDEKETDSHHIVIVGTGHPMDNVGKGIFLGTVKMAGGKLMWHVFIRVPQIISAN